MDFGRLYKVRSNRAKLPRRNVLRIPTGGIKCKRYPGVYIITVCAQKFSACTRVHDDSDARAHVQNTIYRFSRPDRYARRHKDVFSSAFSFVEFFKCKKTLGRVVQDAVVSRRSRDVVVRARRPFVARVSCANERPGPVRWALPRPDGMPGLFSLCCRPAPVLYRQAWE